MNIQSLVPIDIEGFNKSIDEAVEKATQIPFYQAWTAVTLGLGQSRYSITRAAWQNKPTAPRGIGIAFGKIAMLSSENTVMFEFNLPTEDILGLDWLIVYADKIHSAK